MEEGGGGYDRTEEVLSRSLREPVLLGRETRTCPLCGKPTLEVSEYVYEVPHFGHLLITTGRCSSCGFKFRDVKVADVAGPRKIVVRVRGERQLRYLLVKSAYSAVYIREKGFEMVPGPASTGFITTVEGILHRFLEALEVACRGREEDEACRENRRWLERAIEGLEEFTLVICDFEGASKVLGDDVVEENIDEECERFADRMPARLALGATRP